MGLASKKASRHVPTAGRPYMPGYDMMFRQDKRPLSWTPGDFRNRGECRRESYALAVHRVIMMSRCLECYVLTCWNWAKKRERPTIVALSTCDGRSARVRLCFLRCP